MRALRPVPVLVGPTASGKTAVGVLLARRVGAEVIACDAYTVYRGLSILTAAPDAVPDVPHHLVGERAPDRPWNAALFVEAADRLVGEIGARGRRPLVVGGTALYLRAFQKGFGAAVPRDDRLRAALREIAQREGTKALHARLARADPARAREVHENDVVRLVRALEIVAATGRPASAQRGEWSGPDRRRLAIVGLRREPADLERRIEARTRAMFDAGVRNEVAALRLHAVSREASLTIGLSEVGRLLDGEIDEAAAIRLVVRATRRLARKQRTFFASFEDVTWLDVGPDESPASVADRAEAALRRQGALDAPGERAGPDPAAQAEGGTSA